MIFFHGKSLTRRRLREFWLICLLAAFACGGFAVSGAGAQEVLQPIGLASSNQETPTAGGLQNTAPPAAMPLSRPEQTITMGQLAQVDPSSVGLIDQQSGGFASDMWARSHRPLIERLMAQLPIGIRSPTLQDLERRLLLTAAVVPAGEASKPDLLDRRLDLLQNIGDLPQSLDLMDRLPLDRQDDDHVKLRINGLLLTGRLTGACDQTVNLGQSDEEPYWTEVMGFCRLHAGNVAGANLAVEMLQDRGVTAPVYFQLMQYLSVAPGSPKPPVNLDKLEKLDSLLFAMLQNAGLEIPRRLVENAPPLVVRAMAMAPNLPPDLKVAAAEEAALNGAVSPPDLAQIYAAVETPPVESEGDNAATPGTASAAPAEGSAVLASVPPGAKGNAALYRAALAATDMASRGPIIKAIWARAKTSGMLALQARVNAPMLAAIEPSPEALPYVGEIMRLLMLAGNYQRALIWYGFTEAPYGAPVAAAAPMAAGNLQASPGLSPEPEVAATPAAAPDAALVAEAAKLKISLWPWAVLAEDHKTGGDHKISAGLDGWWQSLSTLPPGVQRDRGSLLFSSLEATGFKIPEAAWDRLMEGNIINQTALPALPYFRALTQASHDKRLGETVLLSLLSLGRTGPDKAGPLLLAKVITALEAVGLQKEARQIAAEAMAARGF